MLLARLQRQRIAALPFRIPGAPGDAPGDARTGDPRVSDGSVAIGIDVGGTFTDLAAIGADGRILALDIDFALMTGEVKQLLEELTAVLGGEQAGEAKKPDQKAPAEKRAA